MTNLFYLVTDWIAQHAPALGNRPGRVLVLGTELMFQFLNRVSNDGQLNTIDDF